MRRFHWHALLLDLAAAVTGFALGAGLLVFASRPHPDALSREALIAAFAAVSLAASLFRAVRPLHWVTWMSVGLVALWAVHIQIDLRSDPASHHLLTLELAIMFGIAFLSAGAGALLAMGVRRTVARLLHR